MNAGREYQQHPDIRKLNQLADSHIKKIVKAYKEFKEIEGFSRIVGYDEIKENDFNLNVTLYVFPEEETEKIDVLNEWKDLRHIEKETAEIEAEIEGYLKEIYREK
jgi:type I restriction enzyme M protein